MDPPQKSPVKPPLITPSASPPPRPSLSSNVYNRYPDVPPPLKRRRFASTPHRASHDTFSSSTSRPESPADVQMEREASKFRLLDVWSRLAERYTRRLDEDDIVDVNTGEIIQDRGFIRNSRKVNFGAIAAPMPGDVTADEGTDEDEEEEDVYDVDELDAFADTTSEPDNAEQSEMGLSVKAMPPVTALESANAEDLRAFLEEEQRVKQLCGSEVEGHDHSASETQSQGSDEEDEETLDFEHLDPFLLNCAANTSETEHGSQVDLYVDSASEDELDNWDIDESSVVYPVLKQEDNDSDIEIIDGPTPSFLKSTQKVNLQVANESQAHQEQLHTPPLSHSSSVLSVTPSKDHFVDAPPCPPIQTFSSSETLTRSVPLSPKHSKFTTDPGNTPRPRLDLTQVFKAKKIVRNDSTSHGSPNKSISTTNIRNPSIKPYVLLTPRKSTRFANSKMDQQSVDKGKELEDSKPGRTVIEKGKAKAKADESFETIATATATISEDRKVFTANSRERRRRNSNESKAHSEDPFADIPSQVESPPRRRSSSSSPLKHSVNNRKNCHEILQESSQSPRPSDSFLGGTTLNTGRQSSMPQKRKRVCSDSGTDFPIVVPTEGKSERHFTPKSTPFSDDLSRRSQASTSYMIPDKKLIKPKSSRSRRPRSAPKSSVSGSGSDSGNSSGSEQKYSRKPRSHYHSFQVPPHYSYPPYTPSPHRKQQYHLPPPPSPEMFAPIPDPHTQFIIAQAMQQFYTTVGTLWTPPHDSSSIPYTPSRRHQSRHANSTFSTPNYHPHPYPYSYDPNLSLATLPPESPELMSSPEKSSPRKSSMARSRSRGRRVSFKIDNNESGDDVDGYSSPSNIPSRREVDRELERQNTPTKPLEGKGKARPESPNSESSSEDPLDYENDGDEKSYPRGRTPGPSIGPPKGMKRRQDSKGRLKP